MSAIKDVVVAALREQATEAYGHRSEPGYSQRDCDQTYSWFSTVADWLDADEAGVFDALAPVVSAEQVEAARSAVIAEPLAPYIPPGAVERVLARLGITVAVTS